jgi:uncharacterized membrane protein
MPVAQTKLTKVVASRIVSGALIIAPIYLAALLLLKAAKSVTELVLPLAKIFPEWFPAEHFLSLLLVLAVCFLVGFVTQTRVGQALWARIETSVFQKIPGYVLLRSLTHQVAGDTLDQTWKPALAEIEEALVPAFIIEDLEDGRFTVFVPSVPTPFAGTIYVLTADRVHPLDVPFTQAIKAVSRWGVGCRDLVAAMEKRNNAGGRAVSLPKTAL